MLFSLFKYRKHSNGNYTVPTVFFFLHNRFVMQRHKDRNSATLCRNEIPDVSNRSAEC